MTDERLTDEQVAAVAAMDMDAIVYDEELWDGGRDAVSYAATEALALEVQQSRQRRCGACAWRYPQHFDRTQDTDASFEGCQLGHKTKGADWFCADFTPKEPKA